MSRRGRREKEKTAQVWRKRTKMVREELASAIAYRQSLLDNAEALIPIIIELEQLVKDTETEQLGNNVHLMPESRDIC